MKKLGIIALLLAIAGCALNQPEEAELTVYTTIYPIQYATERIAGETANVHTVYPPGVDVHTYEPASKDMTAIAKSDAFIFLGAGMESFAETAADALTADDITLVEIGQHDELFHTVESEDRRHNHDDHKHGDVDPHIWLDPLKMIDMAEIIKDALIDLNPKRNSLYNDNFSILKNELQKLDEHYTNVLETKKNKKILVSHAAYGYWEARYGIKQIPISGLSSSSEPSQKDLTEIIDQARTLEMDYIIFEQNSSNRIADIIQDHIGAEALTIHNLSVLTDDDIAHDQDYFSLMEDNLKVLDTAIGEE
ncbi:MAG TPA: zinc ABC transporter substrate-binding protein [Bacillota bacterium]|nr:zinc ABC transporter substrate-binding protein [Bacillota bacterium]